MSSKATSFYMTVQVQVCVPKPASQYAVCMRYNTQCYSTFLLYFDCSTLPELDFVALEIVMANN